MRKPPHVTCNSPALLTDKEKTSLNAIWDKKAAGFMVRHCKDPLMREAIKEIRDGYFQLFAEKRHLLAKQKSDPVNPDIQTKIADINFDLVTHNNQSFKRLTYPGYGFSAAAQKMLFDGADRPPQSGDPLTLMQAKKIVAPIIGLSIDCFEQGLNRFYQRNKTPRMEVPGQASLLAKPKTLNLQRTQPRADWVSSISSETERAR